MAGQAVADGQSCPAVAWLKYLFGRLKAERPVTVAVADQHYAVNADGTLGLPIRELSPQFVKPTFAVSTLSALVNLYKNGVDGFATESCAVYVAGYDSVEIVSLQADEFGARHVFARAKHEDETPFVFDEYYLPEEFLIKFRASFFFNDEALTVQKFCSAITSEESIAVKNNGVSQEIEIKTGGITKSSVTLPADGVPLIPWRTFRDANPVESKFLLRVKSGPGILPKIALFEIDAKWKLDTVNSVAEYLSKALPEATIIA